MNTEQVTPRLHHPYSPSKLQCLEACAKYQSTQNDTLASRTGTRQHNVAETGEDDKHLADVKAAAVADCMRFVDEHVRQWPGCTLLKENYYPIDDEVVWVVEGTTPTLSDPEDPESELVSVDVVREFLGTTAGYLDVGIINAEGTAAKVIDYKYGQQGVEPAENNLQGMAYMLGLAKLYPKLEEVTVYFLLPHRDEITFHTFKRPEFPAIHLRIKTVVARAVVANREPEDFSMATPSTGACLFCSRIGQCPKVAEIALKTGQKYRPIDFPASLSTTVFSDPADAKKGLQLSQLLKVWAEAFRSQCTAKVIDSPDFVPEGYDLVSMQKRSVKKAKLLGDFAKAFLPDAEKDKVEGLYDIAIGSLEDLISAAAPRGHKEETVEEFGRKAVEAGFLELGAPFAFLRQSKKPQGKKQ